MGDRGKNIQTSLSDLERWGVKIIRTSKLYETEPVGFKDQRWFYNLVTQTETDLSPEEVLKAIHAIELSLKRERGQWMGPRTIDIDILFYDSLVLDKAGLRIPHPHLHERKFVLLPLEEIAPGLLHPIFKKSVTQLLKECKDASIVRSL